MTYLSNLPPIVPLQSLTDVSAVGLAATIAVGLAVVLGLAIVGRVVGRYRADAGPSLRALAAGILLIAAAPLIFLIIDVGVLPDRLRYVAGSLTQMLGLLAVLRGIYGPVGPARRWATRSSGDLVVAALAFGTGTTVGVGTILLGGAGPLPATALSLVVVGGTFVAGQAGRAYRRRGDPRMLTLTVGTLFLVVAPSPTALALADQGPATAALGYAGFFVFGQALLLATLSGRSGSDT